MHEKTQPNSREEWFNHVEQQEKSDLNGEAYCKHHGLIKARFFYYRKLYRKPEKSPVFTPVVAMPPSNSTSSEVKIELPNGFRCFIPSQINNTQLKQLIGILLAC